MITRRGFSLLELSMVLVVSGLMLSFVLQSRQSSGARECYVTTKAQLQTIRGAVERYARSNDRLPLPAARNVGIESASYGREALPAAIDQPGTVSWGALPFQALGLPPTMAGDCWGNKFTYVVTTNLTTSVNYKLLASVGTIDLRTSAAISANTVTAYAIISHGADQLGAVKINHTGGKGWCAGADLKHINCTATAAVAAGAVHNDGKDAAASVFFDDIVVAGGKPKSLLAPVYAWGSNTLGWRGNGTVNDQHPFVPLLVLLPGAATSYTSVVAGGDHTCGIVNTGVLYCWGRNTNGQTGTNTTTEVFAPAAVSLPGGVTSFTGVSTGISHTCAIANTGPAYCWGLSGNGQIGDGFTTQRNIPTIATLPGGVTSFTQVSAGATHSCGIGNNGRAYCWGNSTNGQIGDGFTTQRTVPTIVTLPGGVTSFISVSAGVTHSCGIGNDGNAYCWGDGANGKIGDGFTTQRLTPTLVTLPGGVTSFTQVRAGETHSCGIGNNGRVYCWGDNTNGQIGDNSITQRLTATAATLPGGVATFTSIEAGDNHSCAIGNDNRAYCWGFSSEGQIGNNSLSTRLVPTATNLPSGVTSFSSVNAKSQHSCGIANTGRAYCWGYNGYYQLGVDYRSIPTQDLVIPSAISGLTGIATGMLHGCGIADTGRPYCWGYSNNGQVGDGTTTWRLSPVGVTMPVGVTSFSSVSASYYHSCGIANTGRAYCWGRGAEGQIGDGFNTQRNVPTIVTLPLGVTSFTSVEVGGITSCGIGDNGRVYCWGDNVDGNLGNNSTLDSNIPVPAHLPVGVTSFTKLSVSHSGACAIGDNSRAYCWGDGLYGKIGDNNVIDRWVPTAVNLPVGVISFTSIVAGSYNSCAHGDNGVLYCWGSNFYGAVGDNTTTSRRVPTIVTMPGGVTSLSSVSIDWSQTCGIGNDGNAYCWGLNSNGQLGDYTIIQRNVPTIVTMPTGVSFSNISAGTRHTFAW